MGHRGWTTLLVLMLVVACTYMMLVDRLFTPLVSETQGVVAKRATTDHRQQPTPTQLERDDAPIPLMHARNEALTQELKATTSSPATVETVSNPCSRAGSVLYDPAQLRFKQILTYVGPVPQPDLAEAMRDLLPLEKLGVVFFALDGTVLNLARWGRIINDNDVDLGFFVTSPDAWCDRNKRIPGVLDAADENDVCSGKIPSTREAIMRQYEELYKRMGEIGVVTNPDNKTLKRLHHKNKVVKPFTCKHRGQFMQCRHKNGVIYDLFGPESLFSDLSGLHAANDILPLQRCRAFDFDFPCPKRLQHVLQTFTVVVNSQEVQAKGAKPIGSYEFTGCALFPRAKRERTKAHVESILESARLLERCGYPSLLGDAKSSACQAVLDEAGVSV